jgi:hypothetical protein
MAGASGTWRRPMISTGMVRRLIRAFRVATRFTLARYSA